METLYRRALELCPHSRLGRTVWRRAGRWIPAPVGTQLRRKTRRASLPAE